MRDPPGGNTVGRVAGDTPSTPVPAAQANPEIDPLDALQLLLDLGGLIPGAGAIPDLLNAAISVMRGDFWGALFSVGAAVPAIGDAAGVAKIVKNADKYLNALKVVEAKVLPKLPGPIRRKLEEWIAAVRKKLDELLGKDKPEPPKPKPEPEKPKGDTQVKPKKKLKCGDSGSYKDLKKKTGDGKFDRDHIPSKAALKAKAKELNGGRELTAAQKKAVDNWGSTIAIPREAHVDVSPTYGQTAAEAAKDAKNLAGSAQRDIDAMVKKIDEYDADGGCKKAYKGASKKILQMTNEDYARELKRILRNSK